MRRIKEYIVAVENYQPVDENMSEAECFEDLINNYIKDGWQPLGGLSCIADPSDDNREYWRQALVKYEESS